MDVILLSLESVKLLRPLYYWMTRLCLFEIEESQAYFELGINGSGRIPGLLRAMNSCVPGSHVGEADLHVLSRWACATLSALWPLIPWEEESQLMKKTDSDQQWAKTSSLFPKDHGPLLSWAPFGSHRKSATHAMWLFHDKAYFQLSKKLLCAHCICPNFLCINTPATQGKVMNCLQFDLTPVVLKVYKDQRTKTCSLKEIKKICLEESEFEKLC